MIETHGIAREIEIKNITGKLPVVPEMQDAYRVDEGRYAILSYDPTKEDFLITLGLSSCKAIIIYDSSSKKGGIFHLSFFSSHEKFLFSLKKFLNEFDSAPETLATTVVHGHRQSEDEGWPTLDDITSNLQKFGISDISIDASNGKIKGIALKLSTGDIMELSHDGIGWGWYDSQIKVGTFP